MLPIADQTRTPRAPCAFFTFLPATKEQCEIRVSQFSNLYRTRKIPFRWSFFLRFVMQKEGHLLDETYYLNLLQCIALQTAV